MRLPFARLLVLSAALLAGAAQAALPPALHAYGLNADLADELGGPALEATGGKLGKGRFRFLAGEGLSLQGAVPVAGYALELRLMPFEISGWRRLVDFKNRQSDTGLYIHDGHISFVSTSNTDSAATPFQSGVTSDVLLVRDAATQQLQIYVDGVLLLDLNDAVGTAQFVTDESGASLAHFFLDDLAVPNEVTGGSLDHLRVFDQPLGAKDAKQLAKGKLPPNVTQE